MKLGKLNNQNKTLPLVLIFGIAMGLLEAIVVVYLRKIFYSTGFKFPLEIIPGPILKIEVLREFCTLIMILSVAFIAGKNRLQVFAYFLLCFAVWDVFYYIGLKLMINWPASFLTWDILFLIPVPWISPVLAPIISSIFMVVFSLLLIFKGKYNSNFKVKIIEWIFVWLGALLIFISFIWDYTSIIISKYLFENIILLNPNNFGGFTTNNIPSYFPWNIFIPGILLICFSIFSIWKREI